MKSLFDDFVRQAVSKRVLALSPDLKPRWGSLLPHDAMCHLLDGLKVSFGETKAMFRPNLLATALGRWFVIQSPIPWPRGKIKAPREFFVTPKTRNFNADREVLLSYLERFSNGVEQEWGISPILGKLSPAEWARLNYRHFDHHLSQFGV